MRRLRRLATGVAVLCAVLALAACRTTPPAPDGLGGGGGGGGGGTGKGGATKGWPGVGVVRDSVYLPVDRATPPPPGHALYTVVLTRTVNRNAVRLVAELLSTTVPAADAAMPREHLNLLTLPVRQAAAASQALAAAREQPEASATTLLNRHYDFGQAALLLAAVCHPERGAAVMRACGSTLPDGPILVSSRLPLDPAAVPTQRLLVVNLGSVPPAAVGEIVAAYRRQIQRPDPADRAEIDGWRLRVLNVALEASRLLPGISKAYAGGP